MSLKQRSQTLLYQKRHKWNIKTTLLAAIAEATVDVPGMGTDAHRSAVIVMNA